MLKPNVQSGSLTKEKNAGANRGLMVGLLEASSKMIGANP